MKRRLVPVLFALTLSFSCCLPLLVILEICGGLTRSARLAGMRVHLALILVLILWALPCYSAYLHLHDSLGLGRALGARAAPFLALAPLLAHAPLSAALARLADSAQLIPSGGGPPAPSLAACARALAAAALAALAAPGLSLIHI